MNTKVIYFAVAGRHEQTEFSTDESADDIRETFRAAAEAETHDILKLYNTRGNLVNISAQLKPNSPETRYRLEVVAAHISGHTVASRLGFDVAMMERRIERLERAVSTMALDAPPVVQDMNEKVESFKRKLEGVEHLSWLGLFKDISTRTSLQPFWNRQNAKSRHIERYQSVYEKFMKISQVQVTDAVREYLRKPTFDNWQWDDAEMLILLQQMFIDLNFLHKFSIEINVLQNWLFEIYQHYNSVPFHNFKHCFMVAQMMYGLTWLIGLEKYLDDVDILILMTSAICHDLDHPGYNNAYQINARTELALMYNDISPLENHHCAVAFEILEKPQCNIFKGVNGERFKRIREGMIKCILATDMAKHGDIVGGFRQTYKTGFDYDNKEHKLLLMMVLMKVSDISNESRPMDVAEPWLDCLLQEFFNQLMSILIKVADISNEARPMEVSGPWLDCLLEEYFSQSDLEKLEGLPVAPFMDREKVTKSSSQVGFIKFVLLPLFETVGTVFPVIETDIIDPVRRALKYYQDMQDAQQTLKHPDTINGDVKNGDSATTAKTGKPETRKDLRRTDSPSTTARRLADQSPSSRRSVDQLPSSRRLADQSPIARWSADQSPSTRRSADQSPSTRRFADQSPPPRRRLADQSPTARWSADQSPSTRRSADQSPSIRRLANQSPSTRRSADQSPSTSDKHSSTRQT